MTAPGATAFDLHWRRGADQEGQAGDPDARFAYWSFSKTLLAIAALKLAERGVLDLDAPLAGHGFSLGHLLTNTSGLPDYGALSDYHRAVVRDANPWSRDELWDRTMQQGLRFQPGQGWHYSNLGYMLLREELEKICDAPVDHTISRWVLGPAGAVSVLLARTRGDFQKLKHHENGRYHPGWVYHGCFTGSAADASRILHRLFAGHLLKSESMSRMTKARLLGGGLEGRPWLEHGYGYGLMQGRVSDHGSCLGHSGVGPGSTCAVYHFPELSEPVTVAAFGPGPVENEVEYAAVKAVPLR